MRRVYRKSNDLDRLFYGVTPFGWIYIFWTLQERVMYSRHLTEIEFINGTRISKHRRQIINKGLKTNRFTSAEATRSELASVMPERYIRDSYGRLMPLPEK